MVEVEVEVEEGVEVAVEMEEGVEMEGKLKREWK
jgi:hypothetical protein